MICATVITTAIIVGVGVYYDRERVVELDGDGDGVIDETQIFQKGKIIKKSFDINADGDPDQWVHYTRGVASRVVYDMNYDGIADIIEYCYDDMTLGKEASLEMDGNFNYREYYDQGLKVKEETDTNGDGTPDKWVYYSGEEVERIEIDSDYDGIADETITNQDDESQPEDERLKLSISLQSHEFEIEKDILFTLSLVNATDDEDITLALPYLDKEHRAVKVFIKRIAEESVYKEFSYGIRKYTLPEKYLLRSGEKISSEWTIAFNGGGSMYFSEPGEYAIYAVYSASSNEESEDLYWSGRVRSETASVIILPKKTDRWIGEYVEMIDNEAENKDLEDRFGSFTENDQEYILSSLLRQENPRYRKFAIKRKVEEKDISVVPELINALEYGGDLFRVYCCESLEQLTGKTFDFGIDWKRDFPQVRKEGVESWRAWWQENEALYLPKEEASDINIEENTREEELVF